jgi:hypothetical protein
MQDVNVLKENGIRRVRAHLNVLISTGHFVGSAVQASLR